MAIDNRLLEVSLTSPIVHFRLFFLIQFLQFERIFVLALKKDKCCHKRKEKRLGEQNENIAHMLIS